MLGDSALSSEDRAVLPGATEPHTAMDLLLLFETPVPGKHMRICLVLRSWFVPFYFPRAAILFKLNSAG